MSGMSFPVGSAPSVIDGLVSTAVAGGQSRFEAIPSGPGRRVGCEVTNVRVPFSCPFIHPSVIPHHTAVPSSKMARTKDACRCGKKIGVNCSYKSCKSCCLARPLSDSRCEDRYHKRSSSSRTPNLTTASRSASSASPSTGSQSSTSTSTSSTPAGSASSTADPIPSSQPYAQPLHSIWAPAAAEVAIEDRLKHKSQREEVAECQTRLVLGALQGESTNRSVVDGTKTVRFLIWKLVRLSSLLLLNLCG